MSEPLFELSSQPSPCWPPEFSPYDPSELRGRARPTYRSRIPRDTDVGVSETGAKMQNLPLTPQGRLMSAVIAAKKPDGSPLYSTVVIQVPRRAAKTTSVWSYLLGTAYHYPDTKIVTCAQDGIRGRNRFREVLRSLDANDFEGRKDIRKRIGRLRWANGDEAIEFDNGSRIWVVPPDPSAFRGEAADIMFFDEAGELSAEKSADLAAGALPLMDTRPGGQIIIAGTPGKKRVGLFWDTLQDGRNKKTGVGIVDYSLRDDEEMVIYDENGDPKLNRKILRRVHPGIGTLTTYDKMVERFERMPLAQFEAEYGCRWPLESGDAAIPWTAWQALKSDTGLPPRPHRVGLAFDVAPDSSRASLVAAWRDDAGVAHVEVLAARDGTDWLPATCATAYKKHRSPIGYDGIGANVEPTERLQKLRVPCRSHGLKQMQAAAARLIADIGGGRLVHYGQQDLDSAVEGAAWRTIGEGGRLFARRRSDNDVTALVAASVALRMFDQLPARQSLEIVTAS